MNRAFPCPVASVPEGGALPEPEEVTITHHTSQPWLGCTQGSPGRANVWLGVSVERDDYCYRAGILRELPARTRWVCAEPLLGPLPSLDLDGIHWLVVGGESGPGWRPMDTAWVRGLREKCRAAGV